MKRTMFTIIVITVMALLLAGCDTGSTGSYADFAPAGAAAAPATTAATNAAAQTTPVKNYRVRNGDQWGRLAVTCGIGQDELVALNRQHGRHVRLWVDDIIVVPADCPVTVAAAPATPAPTAARLSFAQLYQVKSGDTLAHIALQYSNVHVQDIINVNRLDGDRIYAGQTLCIPPTGDLSWCRQWYSQHHP